MISHNLIFYAYQFPFALMFVCSFCVIDSLYKTIGSQHNGYDFDTGIAIKHDFEIL